MQSLHPSMLSMLLKITILYVLFTALGANVLRTSYFGTTYERCETKADCRNGWSCLKTNGKQECPVTDTNFLCRCYPEEFQPCKNKSECPFGEICARYLQEPFHCASEDSFYDFRSPDDDPDPSPIPKCQPTSEDPSSTGFKADSVLSYGRCRLSKDCKGDRECFSHSGGCCSNSARSCYCTDPEPTFCKSDSDCDSGESCVGSRVAPPRCMDTTVRDNIGSEEFQSGSVCIDIDALSQFHPQELVFHKHQLAHVLCDSAGSCATPGHIVVYNDKSMMMRSYCDIVSCRSEVKRVNSPSWKKGMRIDSRSEGLQYTAFAARWGTKAEEHVLNAVIRVGM